MNKEDLLGGIGERLRAQRKGMGLTQEKTAELLCMSVTFYGEMERGKRRISLEKMLLVQEKLNLDPTYLLTGKQMNREVFVEIFKDCPKEKAHLVEQLSRLVSMLYK